MAFVTLSPFLNNGVGSVRSNGNKGSALVSQRHHCASIDFAYTLPSDKESEVTHNPIWTLDVSFNFAFKVTVVTGNYGLSVAGCAVDIS